MYGLKNDRINTYIICIGIFHGLVEIEVPSFLCFQEALPDEGMI